MQGRHNLLVLALLLVISLSFAVDISSCQELSSPDTYDLTTNISGGGVSASASGISNGCIVISAANVVLDCHGYEIKNGGYSNSAGIVVESTASGVTVRNCVNLSGYEVGVYSYQSDHNTFINNTVSQAYFLEQPSGFYISGCFNNTLINNTAFDKVITADDNFGFRIGATHNSTFINNTAYGQYYQGFSISSSSNNTFINNTSFDHHYGGFSISSSSNNTFINNSANDSEYGFRITSSSNYNTFISNIAYDNPTESGFLLQGGSNYAVLANNTAHDNANGFRIEDSAYNVLANNTVYNNSDSGIYLDPDSGNNTLTGNTVSCDNECSGFYLYQTENNTLADNTAFSTQRGFYVRSSPNNTLANNTAYDNDYGFDTYSSSDNTFTNNTAYNSSYSGFRLYFYSYYNTFTNNTVYNNLYDFHIYPISDPITYEMQNTLFLNPYGTVENYTNLSITDVVAGTEQYTINWSASPGSSPPGGNSFENKFLDISVSSGSPSIDSITWHWMDSESSGYDESTFELWEYSGSWNLLNSSPDTSANTLSNYSLSPASIYGIFGEVSMDISSCQAITSPGEYTVISDLSGAPNSVSGLSVSAACMVIASSDVTLDCDGHTITNDDTGDAAGILVNGSLNYEYTNITIRNCPSVSEYERGFYLASYANSTITNSSARKNTQHGFYLGSASGISANNTLSNNTAYNNSGGGFSLDSGCSGNTLANNSAYDNTGSGFSLYISTDNLLANNTAYNNSYGFSLTSSLRNNLTGNRAYNHTTYSGFYLSSSNYNILNNNTAYENSQYGIRLSSSANNSLANNTVYGNSRSGFYLFGSADNNLTEGTAYGNPTGISINEDSHFNRVSGNAVHSNTNYGFYFADTPTYNVLTNNEIYNNTNEGLYIYSSSNNDFINNSVYNNSDHGFYFNFQSESNDLINNTIYNNSGYGLYFRDSDDNSISGCILYNNQYALYTDNSDYTMYASAFLGPQGTYENYTNLTITDPMLASEEYTINWSASPGSSPAGKGSFANKFVNITVQNGAPSIDFISWLWTDSEASGYDESAFELWKYNASGWTLLNDTPDTSSNALSLYNMNPASIYGIFSSGVSSCQAITSPGEYILTADLTGAPNSIAVTGISQECIVIASENVTLDCNGHSIINDATGDAAGIVINGSDSIDYTNVTIQNCPSVSGYEEGIYLHRTTQDAIRNSTAHNNTGYGIYLYASLINNLINNTAYNNTQHGFYLYSSSNNNLTSNTAYNNSLDGFYLYASLINNLINNTAYNNTQYGFHLASSSNGNTLINNTLFSNSLYGFYLYSSSNNNLINNTAYNNTQHGFYLYSSSNNNLTSNTAYNHAYRGFYLQTSSNNILTDNTAYDNTYGIHLYSSSNNNTLTNNTAYSNQRGFYLYSSSNNTLTNNTAYSNQRGFYLYSSSNNTLTSNNAYNNSQRGFYLGSSSNNTLTSNNAYNNSDPGFFLYLSSNNTLTNNTAYNNTYDGFYLLSSSNYNNLTNNIAYDNTQYGIYTRDSDGNTISNCTTYGNRYGLYADNSNFTLETTLFLNPYGTFENYTNLSITDIQEAGERYSINWSASPASAPAGRTSFENKYVNITAHAGAPSIDRITWHWLQSETSGYDESEFELWEYDSGWTLLNDTPDTSANTLINYSLTPASTYALFEDTTIGCEVISSPGEYILTADLTGAPNSIAVTGISQACIIIASENVTLDCNGFSITNDDTAFAAGIVINGSDSLDYTNVTIQNCPSISLYGQGIYLYKTSQDTVQNTTAHGNSDNGIYLRESTGNTITNSTFYNSTRGIYAYTSSSSNIIANNTAYNCSTGITISTTSNNNTLFNNTAYDNSNNGIYVFSSNNTLTNNTVYENNYGFYISGIYNNTLFNNTAYNSSSVGIMLGGTNNLIANNEVFNSGSHGLYLTQNAGNSTIANNEVFNSTSAGIMLSSSRNNSIANNTLYDNDGYGISLSSGSANNSITNNTVHSSDYGIRLHTCPSSTLSDNTVHGSFLYDLYAYNSNFTMQNTLFLNPAGTYENYTNLSITDIQGSSEGYTINWSASPASAPTSRSSFENKFLNITAQAGSPGIDFISWRWEESEASGYEESEFELWEYDSGWTLLNDTPDTSSNALSLYNLNPANLYGIFQFNDTTAPQISLDSPAEGYPSNSSALAFNFTATDNIDASFNCSIYIDSTLNQSNSSTLNGTLTAFQVSGLGEGAHNWSITCIDNSSNSNSSETRNFTVDITPPTVTLTSPANTTYATNNFTINYTTDGATCSLFLDGIANHSLSSCENTTLENLTEGQHYVTIYSNDSVNNTGSDEVYFTVDTIPPSVSISSPANTTYATNNFTVNYTTDGASCSLFLDGIANQSLSSCENTTIENLSDGQHYVTIYANDSVNNTGSDEVYFTVDITPPTVTLTSPANTTHTTNNLSVNYTTDGETCLLVLDGTSNVLLPSCANTTLSNLTDGQHYVTIYANDSVNNTGSDTIYFIVDVFGPTVTITSPANTTYTTTSVSLAYSASDSVGVDSCWFHLNGTFNSTLANCTGTTITNLSLGQYYVTVYANDSLNNTGSDEVYFTIAEESGGGDDDDDDEPDYECVTSSDCGECEICSGHECVLPEDSCNSASDCSGEYPFYECEECSCTGYECETSDDCGEGYACEEGECIPPECFTDEDCDEGEVCKDYECIIPDCLTDEDCGEGEACEDYSCVPIECVSDEDCPQDYTCEDGACVPPECVDDDDCGEGYECKHNECVPERIPPTESPGTDVEEDEEEDEEEEGGPEALPQAPEEHVEPGIVQYILPLIEGDYFEDVVPSITIEEVEVSGAWVFFFFLLLVAVIYVLFHRKKRKRKRRE